MKTITVKRAGVTLNPDRSRVLVRPFRLTSTQRTTNICARVMALSEVEVSELLQEVLAEFDERHQQTRDLLKRGFERAKGALLTNHRLSEDRQLLLGAYFTHEYALEAAALFNPSIVPHPDQSDLPPGSLRFIVSLRATGEGHILINTPTRYCLEPDQAPNASYEKKLFERKLGELGLAGDFTRQVLQNL